MSNKEKLISVSHVWVPDSDRWIYIETYDTGMTGLNYMQGYEYELFKEQHCVADKGLSNFYVDMLQELDMIRGKLTEVEFIDKVMWIYHIAEVSNAY